MSRCRGDRTSGRNPCIASRLRNRTSRPRRRRWPQRLTSENRASSSERYSRTHDDVEPMRTTRASRAEVMRSNRSRSSSSTPRSACAVERAARHRVDRKLLDRSCYGGAARRKNRSFSCRQTRSDQPFLAVAGKRDPTKREPTDVDAKCAKFGRRPRPSRDLRGPAATSRLPRSGLCPYALNALASSSPDCEQVE